MPAIQGIQILLAAVIVTLTGLLIFIGIQVIFILKDAKRAVKKANRVLDKQSLTPWDKQSLTPWDKTVEPISTPSFLSQLIGGKTQNHPQTISENQMPIENPFGHISALQERGREMFGPRVFHRQGKPLSK